MKVTDFLRHAFGHHAGPAPQLPRCVIEPIIPDGPTQSYQREIEMIKARQAEIDRQILLWQTESAIRQSDHWTPDDPT